MPVVKQVELDCILKLGEKSKSCFNEETFRLLAFEVIQTLKNELVVPFHSCIISVLDEITHEEKIVFSTGEYQEIPARIIKYVFPFVSRELYLGQLCVFASSKLDNSQITALKIVSHNLTSAASIWALTTKSDLDPKVSIFNCGYFQKYARERIVECGSRGMSCSILFLDIDDFKLVNDRFGEEFGDYILKVMAKILEAMAKEYGERCIAARYGGEEFTFILPGVDKEAAREFGERINERIRTEAFQNRGSETRVTVSIGVSTFPSNGGTVIDLVEAADRAKSLAKWEGKDRTRSFDDLEALATRRPELEEEDKRRKSQRAMNEYFESRRIRLYHGFRTVEKAVRLEVMDKMGQLAHCTDELQVIPLRADARDFVWKIVCDGRVENFVPSHVFLVGVPIVSIDRKTVWLELRFNADLPTDRPSYVKLDFDFVDSFTQNVESCFADLSPFKEPLNVTIEVRSRKRHFKRWWVEPETASQYGTLTPSESLDVISYTGHAVPPALGVVKVYWEW